MKEVSENEEAILHLVRALETEERDEFLTTACGQDGELRERLLRQLDDETLIDPDATSPGSPAFGESEGSQIGPYTLMAKLGEGGMGTVWMARQDSPVKRTVALKIIKAGMDTSEVIARFEAERQALAMMEHPNIAQVYDAGTSEAGRPYFVMEMVKGVPITQYCDAHQLGPNDRLKLILDVCNGLQHAHQKGVIHRDIKPTNILVTEHDGRPVPKLIDFGIAKATDQRLTEKTLFTQLGQLIGTPTYMSPEQAAGNIRAIDTRSDVYALGVLLFELLTGSTPIDAKKLREAGYAEMQRMIVETEPPRPSSRLSTQTGDLDEIARRRGIALAARLGKLVRGDLDSIVMKALAKNPERRYGTVSSLGADISRYLKSEPVEASSPSKIYRMGKFVRRHRIAMVFLVTILAGLGISIWQAVVAKRQEQIARAALADKALALDEKEIALAESRYEQGRAWLERARSYMAEKNDFAAAVMAAKGLGFRSLGGEGQSLADWEKQHPVLIDETKPEYEELAGIADKASAGARPIWFVPAEGDPSHPVCVAFSPDGFLMATSGNQTGVALWDLSSGKVTRTFDLPDTRVADLAFSPNGEMLAASGYEKTIVWEVASAKQLARLKSSRSCRICFSHDGSRLTSGTAQWLVPSFRKLPWKNHINGDDSNEVAFSPDDRLIFSSGIGSPPVVVRNANDGKILREFGGRDYYADRPHVVAVTPDGRTAVVGGANEEIILSDLTGEGSRRTLRGLDDRVTQVAISPDGEIVAGGTYDGQVMLWDFETGKRLQSFSAFASLSSLTFSPDGKILGLGGRGGFALWEIHTILSHQPILRVKSGDEWGIVSFSPSGNLFATGGPGIELYQTATGTALGVLKGTPGTKEGKDVICRGFAFSADENLIAGEWAGDVLLWNVQSGEVLRVLKRPDGLEEDSEEIPRFIFDADGMFLSCWWGGKQMQWEISSGRLVEAPEPPQEWMAVSADQKVAVSIEDGQTVVLWNLPGKQRAESWRAKISGEEISNLALSSDGQQLAVCSDNDGVIQIFDTASGQITRTLPGVSPAATVFFNSDDKVLIVIRTAMFIEHWDLSSGRLIRKDKQKFAFFDQALLSPDGLTLATSSAETGVSLWSVGATPSKPGAAIARDWFQLTGRSLKWDFSGNPSHDFLGISPHTHVGLVREGQDRNKVYEALFWNFFGAANWNSARLILDRLEPGEFKDQAEMAMSGLRNLPGKGRE